MSTGVKDSVTPPAAMADPIASANSTTLRLWLSDIQCQSYLQTFVDHGVTIDLVGELDSAALRELGISKVGDRIRLENAIAALKLEKLKGTISVDALYKALELQLLAPASAGGLRYEKLDSAVPFYSGSAGGSSTSFIQSSSNLASGLSKDGKDPKTVSFILQDGTVKKVNVSGCFNAQSIKRKVLKRLGVRQQEDPYSTYIHTSSSESTLNLLYDVELVTICFSPDRLEKHRLILCPQDETPSTAAIETSKKIMLKLERHNRIKSHDDLSQYHIPAVPKPQAPTMRNFFGQRPPSELISLNLAEFFPEAQQKDLEATVRNSVRYSVNLSKRFNFASVAGSNSSVNGSKNRMSALSALRAPSISSGEQLHKRKTRTIGDLMLHNVNAIDDAKTHNDNLSIFSKHSAGQDQRSVASSSRTNKLLISASFVDTNENENRYSRIELLSIDSDDDDDIYGQYATFNDTDTVDNLDLFEEDGPRDWLQGARIGAGSFGTVFLGMNTMTGELMAVKQVSLPDKTKNSSVEKLQQSLIDALQHEMSLLKVLNHENIVRYLGSSTNENYLNIFLEYVPGGSVQSMLNSYGPFEEPLIRNFIRQVLIGLSYLHGEDIIHRDIKGANILIDIKGTVKISDFGISKKESSNDSESQLAQLRSRRRASLQGSVFWMAPEVVKQTAYTKKADIWSVGCLIVEMFTGKHPFPDLSQMQAIFKIGTHIKPQIPEWCTAEAKDFLTKTFETDHSLRPDAVDLLEDVFLSPLILSKK